MFKFAANPSQIDEVIGDTGRLFVTTFNKVWYIVLAGIIFSICYSFVAQHFMLPVNFEQIKAGHKILSFGQWFTIFGALINFLVSYYILSVLMHRMQKVVENPATDLKDSLLLVAKKYPILVANLIIIGLIGMAGFAAFIVPGFIVVLFVMFAMPEILFRDKGIFTSIKDSCLLVWGNFWRTLAAVLLPVAFIYLVIYLALYSLAPHLGPVGFIIESIVTVLLHWVAYLFILVQFNDLVLRKARKSELVARQG